jgi:hypothetical protein
MRKPIIDENGRIVAYKDDLTGEIRAGADTADIARRVAESVTKDRQEEAKKTYFCAFINQNKPTYNEQIAFIRDMYREVIMQSSETREAETICLTTSVQDFCAIASAYEYLFDLVFGRNIGIRRNYNTNEKFIKPIIHGRIIFSDPATIFIDRYNGVKIVSKVHDEKYDRKKGLLMCLAKIKYTYSSIKDILSTRGMGNSQEAELCLLYDIAFFELGFSAERIDKIVSESIEKGYVDF